MNNSNKAKNFWITQNKLAFFLLLMFQFNCWDFRGRKDASCVDSSTIIQNLSFWGKYVSSTICVPYTHPLWPNWNVKEIDFEVFQFVALAVESRIENELSSSPTYPNLEFTSNLIP